MDARTSAASGARSVRRSGGQLVPLPAPRAGCSRARQSSTSVRRGTFCSQRPAKPSASNGSTRCSRQFHPVLQAATRNDPILCAEHHRRQQQNEGPWQRNARDKVPDLSGHLSAFSGNAPNREMAAGNAAFISFHPEETVQPICSRSIIRQVPPEKTAGGRCCSLPCSTARSATGTTNRHQQCQRPARASVIRSATAAQTVIACTRAQKSPVLAEDGG